MTESQKKTFISFKICLLNQIIKSFLLLFLFMYHIIVQLTYHFRETQIHKQREKFYKNAKKIFNYNQHLNLFE